MNFPKNISRVHLIYISVIFVIIIGFVSGFILFKNEYVVNIISVSSGIISIIIGMLAIFIAVYQGLTQGTSIQKINESADRVNIVTKKLENTDLEEMGEKVFNIEEIMTTLLSGNGEETNETSTITFDEVKYENVFIRSQVEKLISYYIKKCYENNKIINIAQLIKLITKHTEMEGNKTNQKVFYLLIMQFTKYLSRCGGITLKKREKKKIFIEMLDNNFIEAVNNAEIKKDIVSSIDAAFD